MVFRREDETLEAAAEAVFESARQAQKQPSRKHHLIPASYLKRWAVNGQVRVTETDSHRSYLVSPEKAARETDFYSLASENLDSNELPPLLVETILSRVEGAAKGIIDRLIVLGINTLSFDDALTFALFLAFEVTRGRAFRHKLMAVSNSGMLRMWENIADEGIAAHLKAQGVDSGPEAVARIRSALDHWKAGNLTFGPEMAAQVAMVTESAEVFRMNFLALRWRIFTSQLPLITCDEPVVLIPRPRGSRKEEPGLASAAATIFPLDPHHLLVMFHPYLDLDELALMPELLPTESDEINFEIAAHSNRWLFEQPPNQCTATIHVPPHPQSRSLMEDIEVANDPEGQYLR